MVVDGNAGDALTLNTVSGSLGWWQFTGTVSNAGAVYRVYNHSTRTGQVLVRDTLTVTDTLPPTVTIAMADTALRVGETSLVTFTFSEAVTGFASSDITVENGSLSTVASADGGITWTGTYTPNANVEDGTNTITVARGSHTDAIGNSGIGGSGVNYSVDTRAPTVTISMSDTALRTGETSAVTFTFSEAVTGFSNSDLTVENGTLSAVGSSDGGRTWTATFTPASNTIDTTNLIRVTGSSYTDLAGNSGAAGTSANYSVETPAISVGTLQFESAPTGSISHSYYGSTTSAWDLSNVNAGDGDLEERIYSGSNTGRFHHFDSLAMATGQMVKSLNASFNFGSGSADGDGLNFSFGSKSSLNANFEQGYGTGLSVRYSTYSWTSYRATIFWNGAEVAASTSTIGMNAPHSTSINVTDTGVVTVSIDGSVYVTTTISARATQNMNGWMFGYGGRTGGNSGVAWIDDFGFSAATKSTGSPLALDLNGDGVQTVALEQGTTFDLLATGTALRTGWLERSDGLLAIDLNGNRSVDSGAELFGNGTDMLGGGKASDGWAALAQYDLNLDGLIDSLDEVFANLLVWQDIDGNGVSSSYELKTLADLDIVSIRLQADGQATTQNGNVLRDYSWFSTSDGTEHQIVDAWFQISPALDVAERQTYAYTVI